MDTAARARVLAFETRGHPYPGQKYKHGWIPVAGSSIESVLGKALSTSEIDQMYGDAVDAVDFAPGAVVELGGEGTVSIRLAAEQPDHWYAFGDLTQSEAGTLSEDLDWAINRAYDASEHGHRSPDPVNGLLDWREDDGQVVGYAPDGTIRLGFANTQGNASASNDVRIIDLSHQEAVALQQALNDFALTDLSGGSG